MVVFEEPFSDPAALPRHWIAAPGMAVRDGVLVFAPGRDHGFCAALTRRRDFDDFSLTVDVRIVCSAVGVILRAASPTQYYMVQFDLANDPTAVWFHTFTPDAAGGYRLELVRAAAVPQAGRWYRMRVTARDFRFDVDLGEPGGTLAPCATWLDAYRTYSRGGVGLWEHGGEAGEYRNLRVEAPDRASA